MALHTRGGSSMYGTGFETYSLGSTRLECDLQSHGRGISVVMQPSQDAYSLSEKGVHNYAAGACHGIEELRRWLSGIRPCCCHASPFPQSPPQAHTNSQIATPSELRPASRSGRSQHGLFASSATPKPKLGLKRYPTLGFWASGGGDEAMQRARCSSISMR
ncbi:hypothetical protein DM02DRAFT_298939 [Periconia macrospinosa]|uniref:Uncharacterized protein n=1 Tax=Periconia macrospinosa TaxID=97972 RepID=A0A2V1DWQ1_9PLEO|nr:hypothetical protein DM02DRAFT_298939 [Periconia macrospinosa]